MKKHKIVKCYSIFIYSEKSISNHFAILYYRIRCHFSLAKGIYQI